MPNNRNFFHRNKDGLRGICKDCKNQVDRDKRKGLKVTYKAHFQDDGELILLILFMYIRLLTLPFHRETMWQIQGGKEDHRILPEKEV